LDNRAADRPSKLLQISVLLRSAYWVVVVARVKRRVTPERIACAMNTIGSRLQPDINNRSRFPAVLSRRVLLHIEFLDGVDRQNGSRISGNTRAINDALSRKRFAVK